MKPGLIPLCELKKLVFSFDMSYDPTNSVNIASHYLSNFQLGHPSLAKFCDQQVPEKFCARIKFFLVSLLDHFTCPFSPGLAVYTGLLFFLLFGLRNATNSTLTVLLLVPSKSAISFGWRPA
ncbi:MAG: hypothetical protein WBM04_15165 [Candidatus Korobacteraceae bacterium]